MNSRQATSWRRKRVRYTHTMVGAIRKNVAARGHCFVKPCRKKTFQNFCSPIIRVALERLDKQRQKLGLAGALQRPASKGSSASSLFFMHFAGTLCNVGSSLIPHSDVLLCRPGRFPQPIAWVSQSLIHWPCTESSRSDVARSKGDNPSFCFRLIFQAQVPIINQRTILDRPLNK